MMHAALFDYSEVREEVWWEMTPETVYACNCCFFIGVKGAL